jgi:hypothetical protein
MAPADAPGAIFFRPVCNLLSTANLGGGPDATLAIAGFLNNAIAQR